VERIALANAFDALQFPLKVPTVHLQLKSQRIKIGNENFYLKKISKSLKKRKFCNKKRIL
jgi:hypothetical protein